MKRADTPHRPDSQDLLGLLAQVEALYTRGGPQTPDGNGFYDPDAWLGEVLAELTDPANDDPVAFARAVGDYRLDTRGGLLALIRLTGARAAAAATRHALGAHDPDEDDGPTSVQTVIDEIEARQWWLPDRNAGPE